MAKDIFQKILLALGSLLLCFAVLEIIFKALAWLQPNQAGPTSIPGLPYENTPRAWFWRYDDPESGLNFYKHNSFGMRGRETTLEKPQGVFRVAIVGDSVAHGGNVSQGHTTADYLEKFLGARGGKFEVLNFGVAGYDLREYAILIEKKVPPFSPDLVLVGLTLNDYRIRGEEELAAESKNSPRARRRERMANLLRSHFWQYLRQVVPGGNPLRSFGRSRSDEEKAARGLAGLQGLTDREKESLRSFCRENRLPLAAYMRMVIGYIPEYRTPGVWLKNEDFIRRIIRLCREKNIPVWFFAYPLNEQIFPGWEDPMPQPLIRRMVERNGGRYIEMLDAFKAYQAGHPQEQLYTRLDHMHLVENGHRLVAKILQEKTSS